MPFAAMAFGAVSPFLHLSFVDSAWILCESILSKRYLRLFICSVTSLLKDIAVTSLLKDIAVSAFEGAPQSCALLGLILDPVSRCHCDTFSICSWALVTAVWVSLTVM